jgi:hypothetical protein
MLLNSLKTGKHIVSLTELFERFGERIESGGAFRQKGKTYIPRLHAKRSMHD